MLNPNEVQPAKEHDSPRNFMNLLKERWKRANTLLCVGLDSDYEKLPLIIKKQYKNKGEAVLAFNRAIIEATHDLVCAFKLNLAFYEAVAPEGIIALIKTSEFIHKNYPEIPIILDAKYGDIGNTAEKYAVAAFDIYGADAVTVNSYPGDDAVEPFLRKKDKGVIFLCRTSNKSATLFQNLKVKHSVLGEIPFYMAVAFEAKKWQEKYGNVGLVVGATFPKDMKEIRMMVGNDILFLVPGLGAQSGEPKDLVDGFDDIGTGIIASSSRGIIYASSGPDFAQTARSEATKLRNEINTYR